jgi:hypothetical protein
LADRSRAAGSRNTDPATAETYPAASQSPELAVLNEVAVRLAYLVGQITPQEFGRQDANYERDSALGRELLFLIADNSWTRATSEKIAITRSDSFETRVQVDVELDRITHEAFRGRSDPIWLPLLVLPPLYPLPRRQSVWHRLRNREASSLEPSGLLRVPDALATLGVSDTNDAPLPTLSNADTQHRLAAAVTEIILNMAEERWPGATYGVESSARDQRLMLSAAVYRLLRGEHVPSAVLQKGHERLAPDTGKAGVANEIRHASRDGRIRAMAARAWHAMVRPSETDARGDDENADAEQRQFQAAHRIGRSRQVVAELIDHFSGLLASPDRPSQEHLVGLAQLTERALQVLRALAESTVIVVAADPRQTPITLTVTLPSRALHLAPFWWGEMAGVDPKLEWSALSGFLSPSHWNWILPRARLQIEMLLPSAEADRRVEVSLPDGVALDPSRPLNERADLDVRTGQPAAAAQLGSLISQLLDIRDSPKLQQSLADLAQVKADAVMQSLRDHRVGAPRGKRALTRPQSTLATREFRDSVAELTDLLSKISAGSDNNCDAENKLRSSWRIRSPGLQKSMRRHTTKDTVSPDQVVMRARMIEDVSQRTQPVQARIQVHVAVTDTEHFSIARLCGRMSAVLIVLVLGFFLYQRGHHFNDQPVSAEVLAFVLTLFSAVQAGRIERSDRSTMRGLLAQRGSWLILSSVLPTVILAVALAFSRTVDWAVNWSTACLALQLMIQALMSLRLWWDLARGRRRDGKTRPSGRVLYSDIPDYSHAEVLHSNWWRNTTADALMVGRRAHAYVVWQHRRPQSLRELLVASGPGPASDPHHPEMGQPANVLALQRSGTSAQSVTFAVFRDDPEERWQSPPPKVAAPENRYKVDLDVGRLAPTEDISGVVGIYLGMDRGTWVLVPDHPIKKILDAVRKYRLMILEVQMPIPPPSTEYAHMQWARVQIGLRDDDINQVRTLVDSCIAALIPQESTAREAGQGASASRLGARPVLGIQTVAEGIPRILNPPPEVASPGPAATADNADAGRVVMASDLDVLWHNRDCDDDRGSATWRLAAIIPNWRLGIEGAILGSLDPQLRLVGLTSATLYGKAVMLLLGHRCDGQKDLMELELTKPDGMFAQAKYLDEWQRGTKLGTARKWPLLRVHMRTPDRPGATLRIIESLSSALNQMAEGCLSDNDGSVWYARVVVVSGRVAQIQFTVRLNPDTSSTAKPLTGWGHPEYAKIERDALDGTASKLDATSESPDSRHYSPEDTVVSVALVKTQSSAPARPLGGQ